MSLFQPATHTQAYLKVAIFGDTGTGKTMTSSLLAIGLVKMAREKGLSWGGRPVLWLDSESGSDHVLSLYKEEGVELRVAKTRSFADLADGIHEAERSASVLIVDSVSSFWRELQRACEQKRGRTNGLQLKDHGAVKSEWQDRFSTPLINLKVNTIVCGRAQQMFETTKDRNGKEQFTAVGKRLSAEKELGHEMSLLVMMDLDQDQKTLRTARKATILKDRSRTIDGKVFSNPTFDSFLPHIRQLAIGADQTSVDLSRNSQELISEDDSESVAILLEEIKGLMLKHTPAPQPPTSRPRASCCKPTSARAAGTRFPRTRRYQPSPPRSTRCTPPLRTSPRATSRTTTATPARTSQPCSLRVSKMFNQESLSDG